LLSLGFLCPSCLADLGQSDLLQSTLSIVSLSSTPSLSPHLDSPTHRTPSSIQHLLVIVRSSRPTLTFVPIRPECLHCVEFDQDNPLGRYRRPRIGRSLLEASGRRVALTEASNTILVSNNFASIVKVIVWGTLAIHQCNYQLLWYFCNSFFTVTAMGIDGTSPVHQCNCQSLWKFCNPFTSVTAIGIGGTSTTHQCNCQLPWYFCNPHQRNHHGQWWYIGHAST
jgi:hypothetical protein